MTMGSGRQGIQTWKIQTEAVKSQANRPEQIRFKQRCEGKPGWWDKHRWDTPGQETGEIQEVSHLGDTISKSPQR